MALLYLLSVEEFFRQASETEKNDFIKKQLPYLPQERQEKIRSFHFAEDGLRSLFVYFLLKKALADNFALSEKPRIRRTPQGKPFLQDYPEIFFSFSHSKGTVGCAVDQREIGLDIEDYLAYEEELAERFCSEKELKMLESLQPEEKAKALSRLWVLKEAWTKQQGLGLLQDFRELDFSQVEDSYKGQRLCFFEKKIGCFGLSMSERSPLEIRESEINSLGELL